MLNGSPFYANGFNAYWLMFLASDPSQRAKVTSAFQEATSHGLSIARTWAFSDGGYMPLQTSPGSYSEQMFQGLDFVIAEAKKFRIKLVLSLVDNYEALGGMRQYVEWARSQGQPIASYDDFFTNPVVKCYYKNHVQTFLTSRNSITGIAYKDDPTIRAWELMNEVRCPSDPSGRTVQAWIMEMASHKQQNNPSFLVGVDFIENNQIPGIDFVTVHSYPDQWLSDPSEGNQISFLSNWANSHIQDVQNVLCKPLLFTKFGISSKDLGYNQNERDQFFDTVYSTIYSSARGGGMSAGSMFWQLLTTGMDSYQDIYEIMLSESPSTTSVIVQQSQKINRKGRCTRG
ncbi:hypothetical protein BT93_L3385 [Corymbia citriodora subsp. variegata]|uniref:mannan endo-1,4-beta-mannosidase n=1 Tax=Corymbia citriodora subsp. variegata TaxID=360336 RepID=A0A8T0CHF2_CORYI|nr:hypothetical protein BT93_L3385 [Corymbia citriodora subsp. variegata]